MKNIDSGALVFMTAFVAFAVICVAMMVAYALTSGTCG